MLILNTRTVQRGAVTVIRRSSLIPDSQAAISLKTHTCQPGSAEGRQAKAQPFNERGARLVVP